MKYLKPVLFFMFAALVAFAVWAGVYYYQDRLIFFPDAPADENAGPTPAVFQAVRVKTRDGLDLGALYFPGDKSKPAILWNHGNAYDIYKLAFILQPYIDANFPIYMTEYRGFGDNPGKFSEDGFTRDIAAGWDFLKSRGHEKIVLHGYSMGCAMAARFAATTHRPAALVLEAPFKDLASVARHRFGRIPFMKLFLKYRMNTARDVSAVSAPTLILHGDADDVIPASHARAVYDASASRNKDFILIPGGTHKLYKSGSYKIIIDWLNKNIK